jgi:hypothetical protein
MLADIPSKITTTPTPNPSPQGGGEHTECAATVLRPTGRPHSSEESERRGYTPRQKKKTVRPAPNTTMNPLISRWSSRCAPRAAT